MITAFHIQWLAVHGKCVCVCVVAHALVRVGDGVHFDAQFKVGWHYLFMPLLFLFPLRVKFLAFHFRQITANSDRVDSVSAE